MRKKSKLQFGLRTLLVAMAVAGTAPWIGVQIVRWREDRLWNQLDKAKYLRDQALIHWRREYDIFSQGNVYPEAERSAREHYFNMREGVEQAVREIDVYYADDLERKKDVIARRQIRAGGRP